MDIGYNRLMKEFMFELRQAVIMRKKYYKKSELDRSIVNLAMYKIADARVQVWKIAINHLITYG